MLWTFTSKNYKLFNNQSLDIPGISFCLRRLNDSTQKNRKSLAEEGSSDGDEIMPRSTSGISVRSRRSIPSQKSISKSSVDEEQMLIAAELHDLPEGSESGDSETATEVDVSLICIKFKTIDEITNHFIII